MLYTALPWVAFPETEREGVEWIKLTLDGGPIAGFCEYGLTGCIKLFNSSRKITE